MQNIGWLKWLMFDSDSSFKNHDLSNRNVKKVMNYEYKWGTANTSQSAHSTISYMKHLCIATAVLFLAVGCQNSQNIAPEGVRALPNKQDKIIEDIFGRYRIYQRTDKSYYIYVGGRILYDRLKFISHAKLSGKNNMQALDRHNKLITFYLKGYDDSAFFTCGVGEMDYRIDITKGADAFVLGAMITDGDTGNYPEYKKILNKTQEITTVSKQYVDELYFAHHKKRITFENSMKVSQSILYYKKGNKHGIYGKLKHASRTLMPKFKLFRIHSIVYDEIDWAGEDIYLRQGTLWGCRGKTAIKYRKLSPYVGRLARFELPDGRRGYVTDKGVEYYD